MSRIQRILRPRTPHDLVSPMVILAPALLLVAALGSATLSASGPAKPAPVTTATVDGTVKASGTSDKPVEMDFSKIIVKHQPPAPDYPADAKAARIQGTVVVVLTIDTKGKVVDAKAESGPEQLQACAVDYAKTWTFKPAKLNGKPMSARFKLTMPFKLR